MDRRVISIVAALGVALTFLAPLALPGHAHAQEDDARTLFQRGQAAYAQGAYDDAIEMWTRAFELDPRPLLQYNLSQAYERLGRLEDAVSALDVYLQRADPTDEHMADARARQSSLRERIARTSVRITGGPEGATILVDGEDRGRTPRPDPIQVSPGSHRIVVRLAGRADFNSTVVVPAGQSVDVPVEIGAETAPVARGGGGPDLTVPVILWAAGGAMLITGAILGGVALSEAQSAPSRTSPQADSARGLALGADILYGVGAAAAVAGLVVLLVTPSSSSGESASARVTPWGGASGAGVVIEGAF